MRRIEQLRRYAVAAILTAAAAGCNNNGGNSGGLLGGILNAVPIPSVTVTPAGPVSSATTVTLDASASSDPDSDALTFEWKQTAGSDVALSSLVDAVVTFAPPLL